MRRMNRQGLTSLEYMMILMFASVAILSAFQVMGDMLRPSIEQVAFQISPTQGGRAW